MGHIQSGPEPAVTAPGLLAALTHIDTVGFHGMATALTGSEPRIDRIWAPLIRNARIAVAVTTWPDELQPAADRFTAAAGELIPALERRDTRGVADPAKELHVAYHALSDAGWGHLASTAGIESSDEHGPSAQHGSH